MNMLPVDRALSIYGALADRTADFDNAGLQIYQVPDTRTVSSS